jgi:hypothetical protein
VLLPLLSHRLRRRFSRAPVDLVATAVEDAILEYARRPQRLNPSPELPMERLLLHAARSNLLNLLKSESRRRTRERQYVQQRLDSDRYTLSPPAVRPSGCRSDILHQALSMIGSSSERKAFWIWLQQPRATALVADVLGLASAPPAAQRYAVRRFVERTVKRLKRHLRSASPRTKHSD